MMPYTQISNYDDFPSTVLFGTGGGGKKKKKAAKKAKPKK